MPKKLTRVLLPAAALVFAGALTAFAAGRAPLSVPNKPICPGPASAGSARCHARVVTDSAGLPLAADLSHGKGGRGGGGGSSLPPGYGPAQFHGGYNLPKTVSSSPLIAIVDAYDHPNIAQDLATYSATFGIPPLPSCTGPIGQSATPCFEKVNQQGGTSSFPQQNAGWALEMALDVETAHAICQNCRILLVEANSASYANLMAAVDEAVAQGATVVSNSYGSAEFSGEGIFDAHFDHPGIAFVFSTGDGGYGTEYPAASSLVTAAGGTTLSLNADNSYAGESAWSGGGSGCSAFESKPAWQTDSGCAKRTIADVSADANPATGAAVYDSVRFQGRRGWFQVGGTSLAAPLIAGTYALSGDTAGAANAIPYGASAFLHDVTAGSNGSCGGSYLCTALAGYDGPTGLGSPNGTGAF